VRDGLADAQRRWRAERLAAERDAAAGAAAGAAAAGAAADAAAARLRNDSVPVSIHAFSPEEIW